MWKVQLMQDAITWNSSILKLKVKVYIAAKTSLYICIFELAWEGVEYMTILQMLI